MHVYEFTPMSPFMHKVTHTRAVRLENCGGLLACMTE
jgi:hypothetical protein